MLIEFFKKLKKSKWLPWVGTAPFVLIPIGIMFDGEVAQGVGNLAVFASMWGGMFLGGKFAQIISTRVFKLSDDVASRLTAAFIVFGLLFTPFFVLAFSNAYLGTDIQTRSLSTAFLAACFPAGVVFCVTPEVPKAGG